MGDARAVTASLRPQLAIDRRRSTLLATTALAGVILAAAMASPRSALAQSCSTSGTDPVTLTCDAPGNTITTTNTTNSTSPNAATNDRVQFFNADLIGNVTATTTVGGFGLRLQTVKANGGIAMTNNGLVTSNQSGVTALVLGGNGGAVTYNGSGIVTNTSTGDALNLGNVGNGAISATINNNISSTGGRAIVATGTNGLITVNVTGSITSANDALTMSTGGNGAISATINNNISSTGGNAIVATGTNGLITVNVTNSTIAAGASGINAQSFGTGGVAVTMTGGTIAAGGNGISASSSGPGGVAVTMTGGQIGTSGAPVAGTGIDAEVFVSGSPGNVTVTSGTVFSTGTGINAHINPSNTGNITVTANGNITATGAGPAGVSAVNSGTGTILVTGAGNATGVSAGISAISESGTGNLTVSGSGNSIASDPNGFGILVFSTATANVLVNRTGTASGGSVGINAFTGGTGNVTVTGVGAAIGTNIGIATAAVAGTITIATSHNVTGGAVGISAQATTGAINVTTGGTVTGGSGIAATNGIGAGVALLGGSNNTLVNSGAIVNANGLAGMAIQGVAFNGNIGNNVVTNSGTVAGAVDLGAGANAFNNLAGGAFLAGPTVKLGAGNTLTNAGTFAPGGPSVMTTTLTGNYVQTASGTYAFTVSPAAASRTNASGTANISGAAQALALPGTYTPGQTYTILTASDGLSGTFGPLAVSGSFGSVQPMLTYDANDVFLFLKPTLTSSLPANASANQKSVISAVDAGFAAGNSSPAFLPLFNLTPGSLGTAASQLSGEIATGAPTATFQAGAQFLALMVDPFVDAWSEAGATSRPLGFAPEAQELPAAASAFARVAKAPVLTQAPPRAASVEQRFTAWAAGYGGQGPLNGDPLTGSHDLTARSAGFAAGLDYQVAPNAVIGVAAAGGSLSFGLADGLGSGRGDGAQAGLYGKARFGDAYLAGAAAFARHDISTDRLVTGVPGFFDHLTADYSATSFGGRIEAGRRFATLPNFGVTPYAAWQAQSFTTPDYLEHGLAGFALAFRKQTTTDERTELGAWLDSRWRVSDSAILTLRERAAWVHDFSTDRSITALFQTLPTAAFTVLGATPAPDAALLSARADVTFRNNVSWFARFDGELAQHAQTYSGSGGVKVTW